MAKSLQQESIKTIHLFNCDGLYDLKIVEHFLNKVQTNLHFKLSVHRHVFNLQDMRKLSEDIASMDMDYAVFAVHAAESRLSINEKGAGIGYASIYTALQERTGDKVLVVIGGDDHYGGEEDRAVLSDWAKYKISSQFSPEYMDGRKSFIFSWKGEPNPIHNQAAVHFLLRKGEIFEVQEREHDPKPNPAPPPVIEPHIEPVIELVRDPGKPARYVGYYKKGNLSLEMFENRAESEIPSLKQTIEDYRLKNQEVAHGLLVIEMNINNKGSTVLFTKYSTCRMMSNTYKRSQQSYDIPSSLKKMRSPIVHKSSTRIQMLFVEENRIIKKWDNGTELPQNIQDDILYSLKGKTKIHFVEIFKSDQEICVMVYGPETKAMLANQFESLLDK